MKVVISGMGPFCTGRLAEMIRNSGCTVECVSPYMPPAAWQERVAGCDLLIVESETVRSGEEELLASLMNVNGFLLAAGSAEAASSPVAVHPGMSPEEVVTRVNGAIFRASNVRMTPRIAVRCDAEYAWRGSLVRTRLQNLSLNGAFVSTLSPLPRDSRFRMTIRLIPDCSVAAEARVLYSVSYDMARSIISHPASSDRRIIAFPGMGLFFEHMDEPDREALRQFVEDRL